MFNKEKIAKKIIKKAYDIQDSAYNYFANHKILDAGETLRKDLKESYVNPSHITVDDLHTIAKHAESLLDKELMKYSVDVAKQSAVELAIKSFSHGKYDGKIGSVNYFKILNLMNDNSSKLGEEQMKKNAKYYTKKLDTVANDIHKLVMAKVITANDGFNLQMAIDEVSDFLESTRVARAIEHDADEKYMADFGEDPATKKQDADESYMKDFHNFGQNVMGDAMKAGEFDPKKKSASLDAATLAEKRKK